MSAVPHSKDFIPGYIKASEAERMKIAMEALEKLSGNQMKIFKKEIKKIEVEEAEASNSKGKGKEVVEEIPEEEEESEEDDEESDVPEPTPATTVKKQKKEKAKKVEEIVVSERDTLRFWEDIEKMSGDDLLDPQVILDFQYVGFDPNTILKSIIQRGRTAKKSDEVIKTDIARMCTIAIIKGSITEVNLKKMSDTGKKVYSNLEAEYGLKRGGSKGVDPTVITIARVGAAFPGSMMKILMQRPDLSKKFSGPFGSKVLPSYLRHQSAAACIPETLEDTAKNFLLGLIVAFTSDQSKTISKSKDKAEELYDRQENFITQTHSSAYPSEAVRKSIFKSWTLLADFDKLKIVSDNISKEIKSFTALAKEDLQKSILKV